MHRVSRKISRHLKSLAARVGLIDTGAGLDQQVHVSSIGKICWNKSTQSLLMMGKNHPRSRSTLAAATKATARRLDYGYGSGGDTNWRKAANPLLRMKVFGCAHCHDECQGLCCPSVLLSLAWLSFLIKPLARATRRRRMRRLRGLRSGPADWQTAPPCLERRLNHPLGGFGSQGSNCFSSCGHCIKEAGWVWIPLRSVMA